MKTNLSDVDFSLNFCVDNSTYERVQNKLRRLYNEFIDAVDSDDVNKLEYYGVMYFINTLNKTLSQQIGWNKWAPVKSIASDYFENAVKSILHDLDTIMPWLTAYEWIHFNDRNIFWYESDGDRILTGLKECYENRPPKFDIDPELSKSFTEK